MNNAQRNLSPLFFGILSLPATAMGFALSVQIAALSWILTTQYGLDIHEVGFVWAAGPIAGILGQVIIGIVSDRTWFWGGRRRPFIFIGGFIAALMLLALPNIDIISARLGIQALIGVAIVVALSLDLAINVSFNPTRSLITDVTPSGSLRTRGYTWMQTISGSFGVLAYAIGAYWGNYVLIYFAVGLVLAFSLLPPLFISEPRELIDNSETHDHTEQRGTLLEMLLAIKPLWGFGLYSLYAMPARVMGFETEHFYIEIAAILLTLGLMSEAILTRETAENAATVGFRKVATANALSWIGVQSMFVYMIAFIQGRIPGLDNDSVGQVISISFLILNAVAAILPATVLEPLAKRFGTVATMAICTGVMGVGYFAILGFANNITSLYLLMAVLGVGWAGIVSLPFAIMSRKANAKKMGQFMGLFNLSIVLPQLFVSLAIGLLVSRMEDQSQVFWVSGIALLLSALAWSQTRDNQPIE